ncbi:diguanylate cyclase [Parasulfuritortus cantonensis]|uniref:diguanylate cyclase n=1 Tax=Parasulfuritortus cantonensis TaxID=2528202 RepID=A0A4R1BCH5_9PROT|nr:diguanylate cyclase [Parasulfuritortus cantonensis]TCJ14658.1 diguanylate cyclase [Parasulfuritortus cantonensis]
MNALPRYRTLLALLLGLFGLVFAGMVVLFHQKSEEYAIGEAKKQALNALLVHRAIHAYVTQVQRPEIYRLKDTGRLYREYFSPMVMSFTFISRNVKDRLNEQREQHGMEPIYFKLASLNPRNPINQADDLEADLLRRMNREGLQEYQQAVELDGRHFLYLAVPIERSTPGCMKCHGDPRDAPAELVAMYGDRAGFHEDPNGIRALISIRAPLDETLASADRMANLLTLVTFLVLSGIYGLIAFFTYRIAAQQQRIVSQNRELAELSVTDALTGASNRLGLMARLNELASSAQRFKLVLSVMLLDLDHFKEVNDRHGHPAGDQVLKRFVAILRDNVRAADIVGRWGGEEFLIVAPHIGLDSAAQLAEKLRGLIESADLGPGIRITASIGVAEYRANESLDDLIARADQALYAAKAGGRNRVEVQRADLNRAR